MNKALADNTSLVIKCPECADETEKQATWFVEHRAMFCPACGHQFSLVEHEIRRISEQLYNSGGGDSLISLTPR